MDFVALAEGGMIDPIISNLINFGIGGCMAALVVWHVWYTQTRQMPSMLTSFAAQMQLERDNSARLVAAEREISTIRHEQNLAQSTLLLASLRECHHALNNLAGQVSLHHAKLDMVLRMRGEDFDPATHQPGQQTHGAGS